MESFIKKINNGRRCRIGVAVSAAGILLNLLLFAFKLTAGSLSGSIAVTADGFNHLADAGSCMIAVMGFLLSGRPPDKSFPYGRGRIEQLSGLLISATILYIGVRMLFSSVEKLIDPEPVDTGFTLIIILLLSIAVKGTMFVFNRKLGKLLDSAALKAASLDSLSDCIATLAILAATAVESVSGICIDGLTGIAVALCICYAGACSVRDCVMPLLGTGPDRETLCELKSILKRCNAALSAERIAVHDYGMHSKLLSFYLSGEYTTQQLLQIRDEVAAKLGMEAVICPLAPPITEKRE